MLHGAARYYCDGIAGSGRMTKDGKSTMRKAEGELNLQGKYRQLVHWSLRSEVELECVVGVSVVAHRGNHLELFLVR